MKNLEKVVKALNKEEADTKSARQMVEAAIEFAVRNGVPLIRGPAILSWCGAQKTPGDSPELAKYPTGCSAIGAVLLAAGKERLAGPDGFNPDWLEQLCAILGADRTWVWRFCHGFDYGNELKFSIQKENGTLESDGDIVAEKVSAYGAKLARKVFKVTR